MKTLISLMALAGVLALCGCNTVKGMGQDLQKAGEKQAFERINQISWKVAQAQAALEELMAEWEKLAG